MKATQRMNYRDKSKTLSELLRRSYGSMKSRVQGNSTRTPWLYKGLPIISRDKFIVWSLSNPDLLRVFTEWVESDFRYDKKPSVDRIDASKGYTLDNMRWVTIGQNIRATAISKNRIKCISDFLR